MKIEIFFEVSQRYPSVGEYVAIYHGNDLSLKLAPKKYVDDMMEGISLGVVYEVNAPQKGSIKPPTIKVRPCIFQTPKTKSVFGESLSGSADYAVVLDVYFIDKKYDKKVLIDEISSPQLLRQLNTTDTFHGITLAYEPWKKLYSTYYEYIGVSLDSLDLDLDLEMGLDELILDLDLDGGIKTNTEKMASMSKHEQTLELDSWLKEEMPEERKEEYAFSKTFVPLPHTLKENPYLFMEGKGYRNIAVMSDVIFKMSQESESLFLKPFAREFLIACSYLGSEITVLSTAKNVCQKMLEVADIPYFRIEKPNIVITDYDYIAVSNKTFLGFVDAFVSLYGISLTSFQDFVKKDFDEMRRTMNALYANDFRYDSVKLEEFIDSINHKK
jgi:hypothetical protein